MPRTRGDDLGAPDGLLTLDAPDAPAALASTSPEAVAETMAPGSLDQADPWPPWPGPEPEPEGGAALGGTNGVQRRHLASSSLKTGLRRLDRCW